ncbi:hypothetical protein FNQ90_13640 [Streptomyces alkaliphilus]|uniref:Uncharacterized protein n=1 Tax=Streptomyces alkaliphilus TaxID=1472722 RepID=A0A7W3TE16_9ACTN|nr:hypothetical protein [Streptomyces alkaliphilus]MBB0245121.1 hypothetical protein [Streptomyces alkaliphilus]
MHHANTAIGRFGRGMTQTGIACMVAAAITAIGVREPVPAVLMIAGSVFALLGVLLAPRSG